MEVKRLESAIHTRTKEKKSIEERIADIQMRYKINIL
jgi:hypothetical protein